MPFTEQQLNEIARTQEARGLTRKSAVQFCTRKWKAEAKAAPAPDVAAIQPQTATKPARKPKAQPVVDKHRHNSNGRADGQRIAAPTEAEAKEIVKLYAKGTGMSIPDLAAKFGTRDRGNRIRKVLVAAKVYQGKASVHYKGAK